MELGAAQIPGLRCAPTWAITSRPGWGSQERAAIVNGVIEHRFVRHGRARFAGISCRDDVVTKSSQLFHDRKGKVLVGIKGRHSRFLVVPDLRLDFRAVRVDIPPSIDKILRP